MCLISLRKLECFRRALMIGVSTRGKRLLGAVAHLRPCVNALLRHGRMFPSSLLATLGEPLFCACFQRLATASHDHFMAQVKTVRIHS